MTEVMTAEVVTIQDNHDKHEHVWQLFSEAGSKTVSWKTKVDVQKEGFSDTHATGNQQRSVKDHGQHEEIETAVATEKKKGPMLKGETEIFQTCSQGEKDVLSAGGLGFSSDRFDDILSQNGVPDTACRRTLIGVYTLRKLEQHLLKSGKIIMKCNESNEFRFGNNETLISKGSAIIPACVQGRRMLIRAAILPDGGCLTSLLLSKEFLRELGAEIDLGREVVSFRKLGVEVQLGETRRGHYAIPMFEFGVDCFESEVGKKQKTKTYDIAALEGREQSRLVCSSRESAVPSHGWCDEQGPGARLDAHDGGCEGDKPKGGTSGPHP